MPKERLLDALTQSPPAQKGRPAQVYDSHVHLWAGQDILSKLYWQKNAPPAVQVVVADHDAARYNAGRKVLADRQKERVQGGTFVQIEVDHSPGSWDASLYEIEWCVIGIRWRPVG